MEGISIAGTSGLRSGHDAGALVAGGGATTDATIGTGSMNRKSRSKSVKPSCGSRQHHGGRE